MDVGRQLRGDARKARRCVAVVRARCARLGGASATLLERLGRIQSLTSKARGSLASLGRVVSYAPLNAACPSAGG